MKPFYVSSQTVLPIESNRSTFQVHNLYRYAVARTASLLNSSGDLGRFTIRQPETSGPFTVKYNPGMVPAGLAAKLKVVCTATVPGGAVQVESILTHSLKAPGCNT